MGERGADYYSIATYQNPTPGSIIPAIAVPSMTMEEGKEFDPDDDRAIFCDDDSLIFSLMNEDREEEDEDEDEDDERMARECDASALIELYIIPGHLVPPPPFSISITSTRQNLDAFGKAYTSYDIFIKHGPLEWVLGKRYSDFYALHVSK